MGQAEVENIANSSEWLAKEYGSDPINTHLLLIRLILVGTSLQIWIYSNVSQADQVWKRIKLILTGGGIGAAGEIQDGNVNKNLNEKFLETKSRYPWPQVLGKSKL